MKLSTFCALTVAGACLTMDLMAGHAIANELLATKSKQSLVAEEDDGSRIIVKYRASMDFSRSADAVRARGNKFTTVIGERLSNIRSDEYRRTEIWQTNTSHGSQQLQALADRLQALSEVEYAVVDRRRHAHALPSDSLYPTQWYLQSIQPAAIAADSAWDLTKGNSAVVVAVLDTGVRFDHPDLVGKLLPGYDFVSADADGSFSTANDGDGWDADPSDPGDWIDGTDQQKALFKKCTIENSSWHGTRVAGLIGANTDNGVGIAGVGWNTQILPVRVLGKCGGYDSDILAAMQWAAGLPVSGVPTNPYPAKIINMSLGGTGICTAAYQSVIQQLASIGVTVVVSAGNEGGPVDAPANCPGAMGVAGLRHVGTKVGYSNLGTEIAIAAPAGNCITSSGPCQYSLNTTVNTGTKQPAPGGSYTDQFNTNLGTSFSAPLTSGVAALMLAVNDKLSVAQIRARMAEGSSAFPLAANGVPTCHVPTNATDLQPSECACTTNTCGAGMLNARGAVTAAARPIAHIVLPTTVAANATISFDASTTTAAINHSIATYNWSVVTTCNIGSPALTVADQATLAIAAPASGSYTLMLKVTDDAGATDMMDVVVTSSSAVAAAGPPSCVVEAPPKSPAAASSNSSGGGALSWPLLVTCFGLEILRRRRRLSANRSSTRSHFAH